MAFLSTLTQRIINMNKFSTLLIATCLAIYSHLAVAEQNRIDTIRPDAPQLAHYGAYQTGVKTLHFVHNNQLDIVKAKAGEKSPSINDH